VVEAATELFVERGYAATSFTSIARRAGVARPTVFAVFGSKAALLKEALDQALAGDDDDVPVAERPWFRPVWKASDPAAVLHAYATVCTLIAARAAGLFEVARRAADDSVEAQELLESLLANRRAGAAMVVEHLLTMSEALKDGITRERAIDRLWLLNDPAHHLSLVGGRGWSENEFTLWLGDQMTASLVSSLPKERDLRNNRRRDRGLGS
jgi:AcrR family transcriptional regulator